MTPQQDQNVFPALSGTAYVMPLCETCRKLGFGSDEYYSVGSAYGVSNPSLCSRCKNPL